jgi:hypothetical protein
MLAIVRLIEYHRNLMSTKVCSSANTAEHQQSRGAYGSTACKVLGLSLEKDFELCFGVAEVFIFVTNSTWSAGVRCEHDLSCANVDLDGESGE